MFQPLGGIETDGGPEIGDAFGYALAWGNFNGDAYADLAIGAPQENLGKVGGISDAGAVTIPSVAL